MLEKRVLAFFIDWFIIMLINTALVLILLFSQTFLPLKQTIYGSLIIVPIILFSPTFLALRDVIFMGRSPGKRFTKIRIVNKNRGNPTCITLLLYDITALFWPIDAIFLLSTEKTIGEYISKTIVVHQ